MTMTLKLGTQTASLVNHVYSRGVIGQPIPEVGMGATILAWTDRHAATIVQVWRKGGRVHITVREDFAKRIDKNGLSESQDYEYTPNPNGRDYTYRQAPNGMWEQVSFNSKTQRWSKTGGEGLRIGERQHYHDFTF